MRKNKSGFQRSDAVNRPRIDLIPVWVLERLGHLYADGAEIHGEHNWELADAAEDYESFEASFCRHAAQYRLHKTDEDHFSRVIFNIIGMEHVKRQNR